MWGQPPSAVQLLLVWVLLVWVLLVWVLLVWVLLVWVLLVWVLLVWDRVFDPVVERGSTLPAGQPNPKIGVS